VGGRPIARYEYITFPHGNNSFDRRGVDLGKERAIEISPTVEGDTDALAGEVA